MAEQMEIWRAAGLLVEQRGRDALALARARARELEAQGDFVGAATWRQIEDAIGQLTEAAE